MNELTKELNNLQPTRKIKSILFGLLNPNELKKSSVCEVTKPDTFDGPDPVINGLFDPRMGVIERGPECATCENNNSICPGHFGHIELTLPVFNIHFIHIVMKLLPCVCFRCSNLLIDKTSKSLLKKLRGKTSENKFKIIYEASTKTQKASRCCENEGCRVIQPSKYILLTTDKMRTYERKIPGLEKDTVVAIIAEFKEEAIRDITISKKHRITPEQCFEIFRKITDIDCSFLGFNPTYSRPEWMICTILPVPPPSVRPSVQRDNNQRSEDDLTYVLLMIIKSNNQLKKKIDQGDDQRKIDIAYENLQWNVITLISNKIPGILKSSQRSGKLIKSLRERITGKHARIRGNLVGKRVDFSARTVISVDPNISIDEFGMPKKIAMILTYPDIVTEHNIDDLEQIVKNGPNIHPGAKKIERFEFDCFGTSSPCTINLKHIDPKSVTLKIGDIVHRHIKDGDVCLFNRQPSLHRMNMMAHRAKIVENNTFKLNVSVCLAGDTIINTDMGSITIKNLENEWQNRMIRSSDWNFNKSIYDCGIKQFYRIIPGDLGFKSYEIMLENGDVIKATQEHPFYIRRSYQFKDKIKDRVLARDLVVGDYLVGYEEELPEIDYQTGITILEEDDIKREFNNYDKVLKNIKLVNINPDNKKQLILAGLLGHLFNNELFNNKLDILIFKTYSLDDITLIKNDLLNIGVDKKLIEIKNSLTDYYTISIKDKLFIGIFKCLGLLKSEIPEWIMKSSAMIKRQFLRGYFGINCQKIHIESDNNFETVKIKSSRFSVKFIENVYKILEEFKISTFPISIEKQVYYGYIYNNVINIKYFCKKIGYLYNKEKQNDAMSIAEYCKYIKRTTSSAKVLNENMLKYSEWLKIYSIKNTGLVWKKISKIKEIELPEAFDITTKDENHNFISNKILSQNCKPYNADFDGDEMNVHMPQSIQTLIELQDLAGVSNHIISPATSTPIISIAQDSMVGSYILTTTNFATTSEKMFQYMMPITQLKNDFHMIKAREQEKWSGIELFSTILPNISLKNSKIEIKNGKIISGIMDKATLGGGSSGIIQAIIHQYGPIVCRDFLDNLQRLVIAWMEDISFTIGFGDAMPKQNIRDDIQKVLQKKRLESEELIRKSQLGLYEPFLNNEFKMKKLEIDIKNIGEASTGDISAIVSKNLPEDNNFMISVNSGSKGDSENLNQIMGVVGQRTIDNDRITYGWTGRTLPHFTKWDIGLESKGYVYNSYMNGMSPSEFFFTAMNSRSDAINASIKTAESGYIQRRLVKSMEDLKVEYDGTVRDASNNIVQFSYGVDGFDSIHLEKVYLTLINENNTNLEEKYQWTVDDIQEVYLTDNAFNKLSKEKNENNVEMLKEWNQLLQDRNDLRYKYYPNLKDKFNTFQSPINLQRLILQMKNQFKIEEYDLSDLTPLEVITEIKDLADYVSHYNIHNDFSPILKIYIRSNLSSKECIMTHKLSRSVMTHLINTIKHKILYSIVNPGEMVGVVSAQSIGEPTTQLVLKSYHFSGGLSNQSVITTAGVPRIQEIIGFTSSANMKTPAMKIYLKPQYSQSKEIAHEVKNQIEYTTIKDLLISSEILYIPDKTKATSAEEDEQFKIFQEIIELTETQCASVDTLSNWVLWMEFDREAMLGKNIYMNDIQVEISKKCNVEADIRCTIGNMNSERLTLRIRVMQNLEDGEGYISFFRSLGNCLLDIPLRGIQGIKRVVISEEKKIIYEPDGTPKSINEHVLTTDGSNIIAVLSNDYVDEIRTTTNDLNEIHRIFGIEGTRHAIIREMNQTIKEGADKEINLRHYEILSDLMTYRGKVMQIQRNGFGKSPYISPIGRATYEVMDKILVTAGIFAEEDNMDGTSSNVITAQGVKGGTNIFDLYMNMDLLPEPSVPEINSTPNIQDNISSVINRIENVEDSKMNKEFMKKMNSSTEVKLEDYIKIIGNQNVFAEDNDFNFGYNILNTEEYVLHNESLKDIEINIIKSDENIKNRRRRKH